mgnify:CR=1 FL=1
MTNGSEKFTAGYVQNEPRNAECFSTLGSYIMLLALLLGSDYTLYSSFTHPLSRRNERYLMVVNGTGQTDTIVLKRQRRAQNATAQKSTHNILFSVGDVIHRYIKGTYTTLHPTYSTNKSILISLRNL